MVYKLSAGFLSTGGSCVKKFEWILNFRRLQELLPQPLPNQAVQASYERSSEPNTDPKYFKNVFWVWDTSSTKVKWKLNFFTRPI